MSQLTWICCQSGSISRALVSIKFLSSFYLPSCLSVKARNVDWCLLAHTTGCLLAHLIMQETLCALNINTTGMGGSEGAGNCKEGDLWIPDLWILGDTCIFELPQSPILSNFGLRQEVKHSLTWWRSLYLNNNGMQCTSHWHGCIRTGTLDKIWPYANEWEWMNSHAGWMRGTYDLLFISHPELHLCCLRWTGGDCQARPSFLWTGVLHVEEETC